ncbi:MAG TPA: OB-fold domain-containing protein [Acidimicrobiales bacterium]|jgi:uncharacterized OB-fold protein|nr:OB-fold domain-containing protein [Acidimicrobiales bacterium]
MTTESPDAAEHVQPFRLLPRLDDTNRYFWTSGEDGKLRFLRCQQCGYWLHPPAPRCPSCLSKELDVEAVSGQATLHTFTVNHQPWYPGLDPPYVIAIVELPEQEGLRLTTGIVGCASDEVEIGMPLQVTFEQYEDVWLPFFERVP